MKYQKKMIVPALALAVMLCGTITVFAASDNPANVESFQEQGESAVVWDIEQLLPEKDENEYRTYDEYKVYAENIERGLAEMFAAGEPDLSPEDIQSWHDKTAEMLDFIKSGGRLSKNMIDGDSPLMISSFDSSLVESYSEK